MKLEKHDKSMIFSSTNIPDIFFAEYLSYASGDAVKVYLYMFFLSKYGKDIKINDLSKKLNIPFNIIKDCFTFWESQNVIIKRPDGYILNDLQEMELNKLYKPNLTLSKEKVEENRKKQIKRARH